ncbi:phage tail-collar fiber domain-containing protein [Vibrio campbellii]|uniref:phage tail-collar fiber domain-containing protein n=1 Tax=Vibrio campbellii TaxID=680 RepID=UPI001F44F81C|nr:phage tail protein [Vibrio campbellii]MCE7729605.1 phage tail protein [Vibrio campbellii]
MADNKHYMVVTDLGLSLIEDAYNAGTKVNLVAMALGDSNGAYVEPDSTFTSLVNEFGREDIHEGNSGEYLIDVISYVGVRHAGKTVREFGLYDDADNLIAYGAYPESLVPDVGSSEYIQLEIEARVDLANASAVTITVNPIYPYATEAEAGIIKIIKEAEVTETDESKVDDSKALTLFKLLKRKATDKLAGVMRFSTKTEAIEGDINSVALSPNSGLELLKSRISSALNGTREDYALSELAGSKLYPKDVKSITNEDWNTIKESGPYSVVGATGANRPPAYTYGQLIVNETSSIISHLYFTDNANQVLSRTYWKTNGTWSDWASVGGTAHSPASAQNLGGSDLNTLDGDSPYIYGEFGFFYQSQNVAATTGNHYPINEAGSLIVQKAASSGGSGCTQLYLTYSGKIFFRAKYTTWQAWTQFYSQKNPPTASDVGAVPTTRKVNNKPLSSDITLTSSDVGAVPTTRKVNNKPLSSDITLSPSDIGSLTGETRKVSISNSGVWIRLAIANLTHSASTAKINICGGVGFNAGTDYQSSEHSIIVRSGNKQGDANCSMYTDDLRGCPFDEVGIKYVNGNNFEIYAKSKSTYNAGMLMEFTCTNTIESDIYVSSAEPSGLVKGTFVKRYTTESKPTATDVGALQWKKVASGNCSIAWKNSTRETYMETIETGYSTDIVAREHSSGRFMVKILSKGALTSPKPNECWWCYRGEPREITYWNSTAGTNQVVIDVYACGANLNAGTGATEWELWEQQEL